MQFFQCQLSKGTARQVAWIAERGAREGVQIELGGKGSGDWWFVDSVGSPGVDESVVKKIADNYHTGFESIK